MFPINKTKIPYCTSALSSSWPCLWNEVGISYFFQWYNILISIIIWSSPLSVTWDSFIRERQRNKPRIQMAQLPSTPHMAVETLLARTRSWKFNPGLPPVSQGHRYLSRHCCILEWTLAWTWKQGRPVTEAGPSIRGMGIPNRVLTTVSNACCWVFQQTPSRLLLLGQRSRGMCSFAACWERDDVRLTCVPLQVKSELRHSFLVPSERITVCFVNKNKCLLTNLIFLNCKEFIL